MNHRFTFSIVLLLCLITTAWSIKADNLEPRKTLLKVEQYRAPGDDFSFELEIHQNLKKEIYHMKVWSHDKEYSLVNYVSPKPGRKVLMIKENTWLYIPGNRKPMRITAQQQMMGGISNSDVARVLFHNDYAITSIESDIKDASLSVIKLKKKTKSASYHQIKLWYQNKDYQPVKAQFYSIGQRLIKSVKYTELVTFRNRKLVSKMVIRDHIRSDLSTTFKYHNFKLENLPEHYFQPGFLKRIHL